MAMPQKEHNLKQIWQSVLGQIELKYSTSITNTWFNKTELEKIDHQTAYISCHSPYTKDILQKRYQKTIINCLQQLTQQNYQLKFSVQKPVPSSDTAPGPLFDQVPGETRSLTVSETDPPHNNINPRYTFENFVVGNCNRVAHAACLAVTHELGKAYNPLFIYGGSGLGKTHLLYAIGNELVNNHQIKQLFYFPVETFINDFINSIRYKKTSQFRRKYRRNDCLLIDDIQFIGGDKISTQEEFFHTFNELYNQSRQIVICSDRPPGEIKQLTQRLVTRFAGGLMVEISTPDFETRIAIIQAKAADLGLELNTECAEFIAHNSGTSVREIEGLILKIRSELLVRELSPHLTAIQNILLNGQTAASHKKNLSPELIFKLTNDRFGTTISQLCGRGRKSEIVLPRQIVMYLLRNDLGLNFEHIGELLGGRDHTTVMHGTQKISSDLQKKSPLVIAAVREIRLQLY